jgi:hypothetical protein
VLSQQLLRAPAQCRRQFQQLQLSLRLQLALARQELELELELRLELRLELLLPLEDLLALVLRQLGQPSLLRG